MDSKLFSSPLPPALPLVHTTQQFWGSESNNLNATYGYVEHVKRRWQETHREYQDVGALERFGIDPTKPVPLGVTVTADPYGYPIDGYTTGYTVKLPPPADPVAAQRTPKSFNVLGVVERGDGSNTVPGGMGDSPEEQDKGKEGEENLSAMNWQYGDPQAKELQRIRANVAAAARTMDNLHKAFPGMSMDQISRLVPGRMSAAVQPAATQAPSPVVET